MNVSGVQTYNNDSLADIEINCYNSKFKNHEKYQCKCSFYVCKKLKRKKKRGEVLKKIKEWKNFFF